MRTRPRASFKVVGSIAASLAALVACGGGGNGDGGTGDGGGDAADSGLSQVTGTWTVVPSGTTDAIYAVWGSSSTNVWAVAATSVLQHGASSWMVMPSSYSLSSIAGSAQNDMWISGITIPPNGSGLMGDSVFQHWTGSMFLNDTTLGCSNTQYSALFASTASGVWAVGPAGAALHRPAGTSSWTPASDGIATTTNGDLYNVWSSGADDAIAVGARVWRWSATSSLNATQMCVPDDGGVSSNGCWVDMNANNPCLNEYYYGILGFSPTNVWIVGQYGYVRQLVGSTWVEMDMGTSNTTLRAIWGAAPNDMWVVGDGYIGHWNGATWQGMTPPTTNSLHGIWGSGPNDIWAVGDEGTILHYH